MKRQQNSNMSKIDQINNVQRQSSNSQLSPHRNNPLLLRINADDQDKKTICYFWTILFAFVLIVAILVNYAIPQIYVKNSLAKSQEGTSLATCINPAGLSGTRVTCANSKVMEASKSIWFNLSPNFAIKFISIDQQQLIDKVIQQNYSLQIITLQLNRGSDNSLNYETVGNIKQLNSYIDFSSDNGDNLYGEDRKTVIGYQYLLAILMKFDGKPFRQLLKFTQNLNLTNTTIRLQSYAINSKFTSYTIIIRYVFFFIAIIACVMYFTRYVKIPDKQRIIQQKMIAVASVLIIMFNDPFYPITILKPNGVSAFFSLFVIVNLISFLFFMWMVIADRIYFQDGIKQTTQFTKKKIAYAIFIWVLLITCLMIYTMQQVTGDPIVPQNFSNKYKAAQFIIGLTLFIAVIYIAFRFIKSCMAPQGKSWRSTLFMVFSSIFIFAVFVMAVTNSFILFNYSGPVILAVYGLINIYIYYLQYMFSVTRQQLQKIESGQNVDNVGNVIGENNYDLITVGTIDIVDVNLDEDNKFNDNKDIKFEDDRQFEIPEIDRQQNKQNQKKSQFQSFDFD